MNESLRMVVVLSLIAIISGGSLAFVDSFTKPKIEQNRVKALKEGLKRLIPGAGDFEKTEVTQEKKKFVVYKGIKDKVLVGWGFLLSGTGFQDKISILAATDPQITRLIGIEVLEQKETPGLGDNIKKEKFRNQFKGLSIEKKIGYVKNRKPLPGSNQIQAISAATISTKKLLLIINKNIKILKKNSMILNKLQGIQ